MFHYKKISIINHIKSVFLFVQAHPKETLGVMLGFILFQYLVSLPVLNMQESLFTPGLIERNLKFSHYSEFFLISNIFIVLIFLCIHFLETSYFIYISLQYAFYSNEPELKKDLIHATRFIFILFICSIIYILIIMFGILFLIVPGFIFLVSFFLFDYALIHKHVYYVSAWEKSWALTSGVRWQILFLLVFFYIIFLTINSLVELIVGNYFITSSLVSSLINSTLRMFLVLFWGFVYKELHQDTYDPIDIEKEHETPDAT